MANEQSYADRAQEYRWLAEQTGDPIICACLVELALQYEELIADPDDQAGTAPTAQWDPRTVAL